MPAPRVYEVGERYGRLTVEVRRTPPEKHVRCRCDCGRPARVQVWNLGRLTNSCGCLRRETTAALKFDHGLAGSKIYDIWSDMVGRCRRTTHARYSDYGGRGIGVCDRWLMFANFYADMGERPEGRSLDRTDNDGGYEPENCRWATDAEQRANKRPRRKVLA